MLFLIYQIKYNVKNIFNIININISNIYITNINIQYYYYIIFNIIFIHPTKLLWAKLYNTLIYNPWDYIIIVSTKRSFYCFTSFRSCK